MIMNKPCYTLVALPLVFGVAAQYALVAVPLVFGVAAQADPENMPNHLSATENAALKYAGELFSCMDQSEVVTNQTVHECITAHGGQDVAETNSSILKLMIKKYGKGQVENWISPAPR
jgi:hypothetical protein